MNEFLNFMEVTPLAYPIAMCGLSGLGAVISVLVHTRRAKRTYTFLSGPVPKLCEIEAIRRFEARHEELRNRQENTGALAFLFGVFAVILYCYLFRVSEADNIKPMFALGAVLVFALAEFICGGERWSAKSREAVENRPELACLKYVAHLPVPPKVKPKEETKIFKGSLDDFVCMFNISAADVQSRSTAPMDIAELKCLSDAQWRASHEERPTIGEKVLIVWRDSVKDKVKTLVTTVTNVEDAPADVMAARPGKALITAVGHQFCGGRLAHFCGKPDTRIERGWLATADRAHIMLASLRWLDDDQRELCYQLINPNKPYPKACDWSQI